MAGSVYELGVVGLVLGLGLDILDWVFFLGDGKGEVEEGGGGRGGEGGGRRREGRREGGEARRMRFYVGEGGREGGR